MEHPGGGYGHLGRTRRVGPKECKNSSDRKGFLLTHVYPFLHPCAENGVGPPTPKCHAEYEMSESSRPGLFLRCHQDDVLEGPFWLHRRNHVQRRGQPKQDLAPAGGVNRPWVRDFRTHPESVASKPWLLLFDMGNQKQEGERQQVHHLKYLSSAATSPDMVP